MFAMMRDRLAATALIGLLVLIGPVCGHARHEAGHFESLKRRIAEIRDAFAVPGGAVIIVDGKDIVWSDYFGVVDVESRQAVTPDTMFRIGSVTKLFTATALLQLARRDDFSLDDALAKHIPPGLFFNSWEETHPITVAQLLEHTSGLRDWSKQEFDFNVPLTLQQGLEFSPESRTTHWPPGLHHVYSNANYGLAGLVLENVSGQTYEGILRETVFAPLGMQSATSLFTRTNGLAAGYGHDGKTPIPYWHMIQRPAAAINIRPGEMSAIINMLLNHGRYHDQAFLTRAEVARMETPHTSLAARHGLHFGYGLGIRSYYRNGFRFYEHGGDGDGYLARLGYCRELGIGYFVVINSDHPLALTRMRAAIEYGLLKNHPALPPPPIAKLDTARLQRFSGRYALAAWRFDWSPPEQMSKRELIVRVTPDGNLFTENDNGEHALLLPVDEHRFRRTHDGGATSGFYEEYGRLFFQEEENWVRIADIKENAESLNRQSP